ncbi:MAG: DUF6010 family protein [Pseudomonadota bacterium]
MPDLTVMLVVQNILGGVMTIVLVGLLHQPYRQSSMVMLVCFAHGIYMNGAIWPWEIALILPGVALAWWGLRWYPAIGLSWMVHTVLDYLHHQAGAPVIATQPHSSLGCFIYDPILAVWFFFGAPGLLDRRRARDADQCNAET